MKLTQLINEMVEENKRTQQQVHELKEGVTELEVIINETLSYDNLMDLVQKEFFKSEYFHSEAFYHDIGAVIIDKYGLGKLVNLDEITTKRAIIEWLESKFSPDNLASEILKKYSAEVRDSMIRRIRLESKSILDNYDFSNIIYPRLQEHLARFLEKHDLTTYTIKQSAKLLLAQETNLNFMLEYFLNRQL